MYLSRFEFLRVLGGRSETEPARSDFGEKDPPSTVGVVESAGGPPGSGQVYRVGWATG